MLLLIDSVKYGSELWWNMEVNYGFPLMKIYIRVLHLISDDRRNTHLLVNWKKKLWNLFELCMDDMKKVTYKCMHTWIFKQLNILGLFKIYGINDHFSSKNNNSF